MWPGNRKAGGLRALPPSQRQAVGLDGGSAKNLRTFLFGLPGKTLAKGAFDRLIVGCDQADRPIRAEQASRRAENGKDLVHIGLQILLLPVPPVGFRDHPGQLAPDMVAMRPEALHQSGPRLHRVLRNARFCDVVDHETQIAMPRHRLQGSRNLRLL